jgi:hypothetical protein
MGPIDHLTCSKAGQAVPFPLACGSALCTQLCARVTETCNLCEGHDLIKSVSLYQLIEERRSRCDHVQNWQYLVEVAELLAPAAVHCVVQGTAEVSNPVCVARSRFLYKRFGYRSVLVSIALGGRKIDAECGVTSDKDG